jgi:hypothetical protein
MSTPKIIAVLERRSGAEAKRMTDENLKRLHQLMHIELIYVRQAMRERGMHDKIKSRLITDDGQVF